jgi:site-specific DNA recombinase
VRKERYRGPWSFTRRHRTYLLAGLVRCAACGSKLWSQHLSGHDYYREESGLRGIPCSNTKTVIRGEVLEAQVEEIITSLRLPRSWREQVVEYLQQADEHRRLREERKRLENRLRRLQEVYLDGYPEADYKREKESIRAALSAMGEPAEEEVLVLGDHVEGLLEAWGHATKEEKRDLLKMMLEAVYVDVPGKKLVALQVKPAFKPLFRAWLDNEEPQQVSLRFGSNIVYGDPMGTGAHT